MTLGINKKISWLKINLKALRNEGVLLFILQNPVTAHLRSTLVFRSRKLLVHE